jgi:DNA-binding transcriptional regulator YiaG
MGEDRTSDRLGDMLRGLQGRGRPVSDVKSDSLPEALPVGEKVTERPEDTQEGAKGFRAMREALGLSIVDAAALLRAAPRTLYAWEDGTMQVNPTAWLLLQILLKYPGVRKWVEPPGAAPGKKLRIGGRPE